MMSDTQIEVAGFPLVIPTKSQTPSARLVLRNDLGQVIQQWLIRQNKCTLGSSHSCALRCELPGIAPYHALLVVGARQIFVRALATKVTRDGEPVNEILLSNEHNHFEIAGHRFELNRGLPSADESSSGDPANKRMKFTLARPFELRKRPTSSPAEPVAKPEPKRDVTRSADVKWVAQLIQSAIEPLECQLQNLVEPLTELQSEARRQRETSETESRNRESEALSKNSASERFAGQLEGLAVKQSAAIEVITERISDVHQQLGAIERIVAQDREQDSGELLQLTEQTLAQKQAIEQLQGGMISVSSAIQDMETRQGEARSEDRAWKSEIQTQITNLRDSVQLAAERADNAIALANQPQDDSVWKSEVQNQFESLRAAIENATEQAASQRANMISPVEVEAAEQTLKQDRAWRDEIQQEFNSIRQTLQSFAERQSHPGPATPERAENQFVSEPFAAKSSAAEPFTIDEIDEQSEPDPSAELEFPSFDTSNSNDTSSDASTLSEFSTELSSSTWDDDENQTTDAQELDQGQPSDVNDAKTDWPKPSGAESQAESFNTGEIDSSTQFATGDFASVDSLAQFYSSARQDASQPVADDEVAQLDQDVAEQASEVEDWNTEDQSGSASEFPTLDAADEIESQPEAESDDQFEGFNSEPAIELETGSGQLETDELEARSLETDSQRLDEESRDGHSSLPSWWADEDSNTAQDHHADDSLGRELEFQGDAQTTNDIGSVLDTESTVEKTDQQIDEPEFFGFSEPTVQTAIKPTAIDEVEQGGALADLDEAQLRSQVIDGLATEDDELTSLLELESVSDALAVPKTTDVPEDLQDAETLDDIAAQLPTPNELASEYEVQSELPASGGQAAAEIAGDADTEDASVEDYMRRLLARMRGVPEDEVEVPKPATPPTQISNGGAKTKEYTSTDLDTPTAPTSTTSDAGIPTVARPATESIGGDTTAPFDPEKYVPRVAAPERARNLAEMRALANSSARTAINKSTRKRHVASIVLKLTIAVIGLVVAGSLIAINGFNVNIGLVATFAALLVAAIWGYDAMTSIKPLFQARESKAIAPTAEDEGQLEQS